MTVSSKTTDSCPPNRWWEISHWEEVCLIAIQYRKIVFAFLIAVLLLYIQDRIASMDPRLFRPSLDGLRGLAHYEIAVGIERVRQTRELRLLVGGIVTG